MGRFEDDSTRRIRARELAGRIRATRASAVERLRCGDIRLDQLLESTDPLIGHVKIVTLVESLPDLGKVKARRILGDLGIPDSCRMGELDEPRRQALLERAAGTGTP